MKGWVIFILFFRSELKTAMKKIDEKFSDREIEQLIAEADMDADGEVNFKEFTTIMKKMNQ